MSAPRTRCPHCEWEGRVDTEVEGSVRECPNCATDFCVELLPPRKLKRRGEGVIAENGDLTAPEGYLRHNLRTMFTCLGIGVGLMIAIGAVHIYSDMKLTLPLVVVSLLTLASLYLAVDAFRRAGVVNNGRVLWATVQQHGDAPLREGQRSIEIAYAFDDNAYLNHIHGRPDDFPIGARVLIVVCREEPERFATYELLFAKANASKEIFQRYSAARAEFMCR